MRAAVFIASLGMFFARAAIGGSFAPAAGQPGSTAIASSDPAIAGWASGFSDLVRGPMNLGNLAAGLASFGTGNDALGPANVSSVVSLGDGGQITLSFARAIFDGPGFDLAVFENGFSDTFLELAFVEVSSNGSDFLRFAATSQTQTITQVPTFGSLDATNLDNLAGKYRGGFGTPFDLAQLAGLSPQVDVNQIRYVRIRDVVGAIDPRFGTLDSHGNRINDPFPTEFPGSGFDLDAVAAMHVVPEPGTAILLAAAILIVGPFRARWRRGR